MTFTGFPWNTRQEEVKLRIKEIVKAGIGLDIEVATTRKRTSFGFARFATQPQKSEFKKWLAKETEVIKCKGLHDLRIGDNEDKEQQARGRAVSKVKRALMEARANRTDLDVDRRAGEVFIGTERVAKWVGDHLRLKGEALTVKSKIDQLLKEKRLARDELSEESE